FATRCLCARPGGCDQSPPPPERHGTALVACHRADDLTSVPDALAATATAPHSPQLEDG
ncbi:hypothetical protein JBE27_24455, partial [Streptomyces albiflaviniger]|nr:hypothetical protein [Streptomyces albiflaviniger]